MQWGERPPERPPTKRLSTANFLLWVSTANGKYCKTEYLMKSIEYQMAGLTMDYESTPQVKQPEYLMKSIEYRWPFSPPADPAGPLRFCRTLLANRPAGTCWTPVDPAGRFGPEGPCHITEFSWKTGTHIYAGSAPSPPPSGRPRPASSVGRVRRTPRG